MIDIKETIDLCLKKENSAYQKLYDAMYSTVYNTCMRYAPNETIAKDYIQECYIRIFDKLDVFIGDNMADLGAWVKRLCVNYCVDQARGLKPLFCDYVEVKNLQAETDDEFVNKYTLTQILDAIHKLSPRYKTIFNMFMLDGYTHQEITKKLGLKPGTSNANLFKAKRRVREILLSTT